MKTPSYILGPDFISVVFGSKPHTIYSNDTRFAQAKEIIKAQDWDQLESILDLPKAIALFTFGKVQVFDGQIIYNGKVARNALTSRILEFIKEGFPFQPLVKFMDKLMLNPCERSVEQLYDYLERYKLPITEDGDFIAQKNVTEHFLDHHTKKIDNSLGQIVEVDRAKVDPDPQSACSFGLHVGCESYVKTFGTNGIVILCQINPKDVVSVPHDCNSGKMRVCRYEVIGVVGDAENAKPFSSNYAKNSDVTNINKKVVDATPVKSDVKKVIGSNKAYELHKSSGNALYSPNYGKAVMYNENKPRTFFRDYKDWYVISAEELLALENKKPVSRIGANKAYELYKQGKKVTNVLTGIIAFEDNKSRTFFRSYKDWELIG